MIDNFAIFLFSTLIVYTVLRAVKLDKLLSWFSAVEQKPAPRPKKKAFVNRGHDLPPLSERR